MIDQAHKARVSMYNTKALTPHFVFFFLSAVQYFYSIVVVLAAKLTHKFLFGSRPVIVFYIGVLKLGTTEFHFTGTA